MVDKHEIRLHQELEITVGKKDKERGILSYNSYQNGIAYFTFTTVDKKYNFGLRLACEGMNRRAAIVGNNIFQLENILPNKTAVLKIHCSCARSSFLNCINPF
jgi:hypothetical protein